MNGENEMEKKNNLVPEVLKNLDLKPGDLKTELEDFCVVLVLLLWSSCRCEPCGRLWPVAGI